jgi:hypothetical protein
MAHGLLRPAVDAPRDDAHQNGRAMEARFKLTENNSVTQATDQLVSPTVFEQLSLLRPKFENARPFKHLVIEDFFRTDVAEALCHDFPVFDPIRALNEFGKVGNKAVNEHIETLSLSHPLIFPRAKNAIEGCGRSDGSPLTSPHPQISGSEMPSKRASPAQSRPFWPSVLAE